MTGASLTKVNTFRSMPEEREEWDKLWRQEGFKDFTAFVRTRLNGGRVPSPLDAVETAENPAAARTVLPAPLEDRPPPGPPHHPNCTCTVCKARNQG